MSTDSLLSKFDFLRSMPNLIIFSLFAVGALVLVWVGSLTINDVTVWNKDMGTIFFGSRTGEAISLGIGMTLINYVYVALAFFGAGAVMFIRNRMLVNSEVEPLLMMSSQKSQKHNEVKQGNCTRKSVSKNSVAASEDRFFSGCLHHFGYLSSRPKDEPVPQECILCQRLGDCMLATVYVKEIRD
ncbi:MAG: hypothetical protein QCH99_10585 [Candidatus Bathyarchaeota archaeon]|nr:hypothetical protein [Candidatus Bathyarchaeum tardum]